MKAYLISENISFDRYQDPKRSMGLGMMNKIKEFIFQEGYNNSYNDIDYYLCICSKEGKEDFVKFLINLGADVHYKEDRSLRRAAENGYLGIVKILLDAGANVRASNGGNSLAWAASNGHLEVVKLLLDSGADIRDNNYSALRWAYEDNRTDVIKYLQGWMIKHGISIPDDTKINENIGFERGINPKNIMKLGSSRIPKKGEKFIAFYGPETGWIEVTAYEDPTYYEEITSNGKILSPNRYECWVVIPGKEGRIVAQYLEKDLEKKNQMMESQNFERGLDPKKSMNIGLYQKMKDIGEILVDQTGDPEDVEYDEDNFVVKYLPCTEDVFDEFQVKYNIMPAFYFSSVISFNLKTNEYSDTIYASNRDMPGWSYEESTDSIIIEETDANEIAERMLGIWEEGLSDFGSGMIKSAEKYMKKKKKISESQNFERGLDPKKSMKLGLAANPIIINELIYGVPNSRNRYYDRLDYLSMGDDKAKKILEDLEIGIFKYYPFWHYHNDETNEDIKYPVKPDEIIFQDNNNQVVKLKDMLGKYIQYEGVIYLIPANLSMQINLNLLKDES